MIIKFEKMNENAVEPLIAHIGDAGADLTACEVLSKTQNRIVYDTGIAVEIPAGNVGLIFPRSSIRKYDLILSNSVGVIDSSYRGSIQVTFNKIESLFPKLYEVGDKIAQLIIVPIAIVNYVISDDLSDTLRGHSGHGSTGK